MGDAPEVVRKVGVNDVRMPLRCLLSHLMGRTLSEEQEALLVRSGAGLLTLLLDGNEAGRKPTEELLGGLSREFFVRGSAPSRR